MNIPSYGNPLVVGHRLLEGLFSGPVLVQEKVDGSQFNFMVDPTSNEIRCRSRKAVIDDTNLPALFRMAYERVHEISPYLTPGWVYRAEAVTSVKHNTIKYGRIPEGGLIVYDIDFAPGEMYSNPGVYKQFLKNQGDRSSFEVVPCFFAGSPGDDVQRFLVKVRTYLERQSCLRGDVVEGVVIKNLMVLGVDKKPLMGKIVRDDFKELNDKEWKTNNPGKNDFLDQLGDRYRTDARWQKAVQHLDELALLEWEPHDIPKLIGEVKADVLKECEQEIKDELFKHFWQTTIQRKLTAGLAEWYKNKLIERLG